MNYICIRHVRLQESQKQHISVLLTSHQYLAIWGPCDKHSPWVLNHTSLGLANSAWWIFLRKKGGVISEVTLMWATFIKPRSRGSGWNWKMEKVVILGGLQASRGTKWGRGEENKQTALMQSWMIANGLEIRQVGSACLHVVNCSQLIHHSCLNISLLQPLLSIW